MKHEEERKRKPEILTQERRAGLLEAVPQAGLAVAGRSVTRTDAWAKVSGRLRFGADYPSGGFLHGAILRSPHPHARIKSVRVEAARALPGVAAVLAHHNGRSRPMVSFEIRPMAGQDSRVVIAHAKRALRAAWAGL